jgi:hypothetical protein
MTRSSAFAVSIALGVFGPPAAFANKPSAVAPTHVPARGARSLDELLADERSTPLRASCGRGDTVEVSVFNRRREPVEIRFRLPGESQWWATSRFQEEIGSGLGEPLALCPGVYDVRVIGVRSKRTLSTTTAVKLDGRKGFRVTAKGDFVTMRVVTPDDPHSRWSRIVVSQGGTCVHPLELRFEATFKDGRMLEGDQVLSFDVSRARPLPVRIVARHIADDRVVASTTIKTLGFDVLLQDDCTFDH